MVMGTTTVNPVARLYCTTHPAMGTEYSLYLYAPSREEAESIAKPVFEEVDRIDALLSNYRPDSDNRSGDFSLSRKLPGLE
jgi:hypothetical protein